MQLLLHCQNTLRNELILPSLVFPDDRKRAEFEWEGEGGNLGNVKPKGWIEIAPLECSGQKKMSEGKGKRKRETERVRDSDITSKAPSQLFFLLPSQGEKCARNGEISRRGSH